MRKYTTVTGKIVDLNDPKTYKDIKAKTLSQLDGTMFYDIGFLTFWMNYAYPQRFTYFTDFDSRQRLEAICKNVAKSYHKNLKNKTWFKEKIFLLHDLSIRMAKNKKKSKL